MDGWNTIVSFWDGVFSGAMLVSGRVSCKLFNQWNDEPGATITMAIHHRSVMIIQVFCSQIDVE